MSYEDYRVEVENNSNFTFSDYISQLSFKSLIYKNIDQN